MIRVIRPFSQKSTVFAQKKKVRWKKHTAHNTHITTKNKIMNRITHHKQMFSQFDLMNRVHFENTYKSVCVCVCIAGKFTANSANFVNGMKDGMWKQYCWQKGHSTFNFTQCVYICVYNILYLQYDLVQRCKLNEFRFRCFAHTHILCHAKSKQHFSSLAGCQSRYTNT